MTRLCVILRSKRAKESPEKGLTDEKYYVLHDSLKFEIRIKPFCPFPQEKCFITQYYDISLTVTAHILSTNMDSKLQLGCSLQLVCAQKKCMTT